MQCEILEILYIYAKDFDLPEDQVLKHLELFKVSYAKNFDLLEDQVLKHLELFKVSYEDQVLNSGRSGP